MRQSHHEEADVTQAAAERIDALVIGAGVTGLYQLYCLLQVGLDARIYEAGEGVGGTWYWNRYPGARLDSESWSYSYSFSEELLQEWEWTESFVGQPELERYLNYVADKFELRPHIRLGARVRSAIFDEETNRWNVETEDGRRANARYVIAATGLLSANFIPDIPGIESFEGQSFHTSRWPHEPVDFTGKRVGVIGTGSTGVQVIPEVAKTCGHLTVFQRTPNYCSPLRNSPIDADRMREIKASYDEVFQTCRQNTGGFIHNPDPRSTFDVTPEERLAFYEDVWGRPGFAKWFGNFQDLMTNRQANEIYCEFVRNKIRERVKDPVVAEKLCPKDHHYGAKRVPLETDYYETYNRDNVLLVDVREDPIQRITPKGLETKSAAYDLDVLIYATGFDAATGEVTRMDVRGVGGQTIQERWADGATMYMGLQTAGFPNLFFENGTLFCNFTRCAEATAEFVSRCIAYMRDNGYTRIEADPQAEARWLEHTRSLSQNRLTSNVSNWADGSNIPGKPKVEIFYSEGFAAYLKLCVEVEAKGYAGFNLK
jgi:cation diffusion facilitator CzcD-associated flavoprotein CzcO